jgi:hypothetical protein
MALRRKPRRRKGPNPRALLRASQKGRAAMRKVARKRRTAFSPIQRTTATKGTKKPTRRLLKK